MFLHEKCHFSAFHFAGARALTYSRLVASNSSLKGLSCLGNEDLLVNCFYSAIYQACSRGEVAGVFCEGQSANNLNL